MNLNCLAATVAILFCENGTSQILQTDACVSGESLSVVVEGNYQGRAFDLLKDRGFRETHDIIAAKEPPWIKSLDGPSPENRLFAKDGSKVVIFSSCKVRACGKARLYGAIDKTAGTHGLLILEDGTERVLGKLSANAVAGVRCARSMDVIRGKRALDQIRRDAK